MIARNGGIFTDSVGFEDGIVGRDKWEGWRVRVMTLLVTGSPGLRCFEEI